MKKVFKIIIIVIVVLAILFGLFIGLIYLSKYLHKAQLNRERINNSKTLSQYIENHDQEHTLAKDNTCNFLGIDTKNINCDLLDNHNILFYYLDENSGILILDDYSIYETVFGTDKLYSNNKQYKTLDLGINIKRIQTQIDEIYFITDNNEYYYFDKYSHSISKKNVDTYSITDNLLKDDTIVKIITYRTNAEKECNEYYVLKTDGQVYMQEYNYLNSTSFIKETLYLSKDTYGKITDVEYGSYIRNSANSSIEYKTTDIIKLVSDNGLYYLKPIQTEDSEKYVDIEPTYEMSKSEIYSKYKDDIISMNCKYVFTKDNSIINTNYLCNDLDKEVK